MEKLVRFHASPVYPQTWNFLWRQQMREKSDKQLCIRLPKSLDIELDNISNYFQLSKSDVIKRFCRDGLEKFRSLGHTNKNSNYFLLER
jgi:hypothetical protein